MVRGVEKSDVHSSVGLNLGRLTLESFKAASPSDLTADTSGFFDGAPIDLRTFQRLNEERIPMFKHTLDEWSEMEWGCAAAGEVGELCNMLKKRHRQGDPDRPGYDLRGKKTPTADEAGEEIADAMIYLAACASRLRVDLNSAIRAKWNKVSAEVGFAGRL